VDYIMAESTSGEYDYVLKHPVPGHLHLIGFPEISMAGMYPWGGFGANPQPARLQKEWTRIRNRVQGGFPYSGGIYEDLNKVILAQFYWDPGRDAFDAVREYSSYNLSPQVAPEMVDVVRILEQDHHLSAVAGSARGLQLSGDRPLVEPSQGGAFKRDPDAQKAFKLVQPVQSTLPPYARSSWRWRDHIPARTS
jgi:hypothetical protein